MPLTSVGRFACGVGNASHIVVPIAGTPANGASVAVRRLVGGSKAMRGNGTPSVRGPNGRSLQLLPGRWLRPMAGVDDELGRTCDVLEQLGLMRKRWWFVTGGVLLSRGRSISLPGTRPLVRRRFSGCDRGRSFVRGSPPDPRP